ncbi:MAG: ROK family protein [Verrucomicrobia bacterium]|nr:ROK family protein [Verrucomicrobiota bacterium]
MSKPSDYVVGVDLGGTKILSAVIDRDYKIVGTAKKNTRPERGPKVVMERIAACITEALDECELKPSAIRAIGIGAPGMCDPATGTVLFAPNLAWRREPLGKRLSRHFGVPVFVENDVNVGTLGVYHLELARAKNPPRSVVGMFLGTGIGGGIILNGELFRGHNFTAGEVGHMILRADGGPQCGCGNRGCFEAFAGRLALVRRIAAAAKKKGGNTPLHKLLKDEKDHKIKSRHIAIALRKRDPVVCKLVGEVADYVGFACVNLIHILNPDVIVLGGGVMQSFGEFVMPRVQKIVRKFGIPACRRGVKIVGTELGDEAGILGAAVLAWQNLDTKPRPS